MPNNQDDLNRKLNYLNETKQEIKRSLKAKGQPVNDNTTFREYANLVNNITTGTDTDDATATADDIINPKTAYVKGQKITGNIMPKYENEYDDILEEYTLLLNNISINNIFCILPNESYIIYIDTTEGFKINACNKNSIITDTKNITDYYGTSSETPYMIKCSNLIGSNDCYNLCLLTRNGRTFINYIFKLNIRTGKFSTSYNRTFGGSSYTTTSQNVAFANTSPDIITWFFDERSPGYIPTYKINNDCSITKVSNIANITNVYWTGAICFSPDDSIVCYNNGHAQDYGCALMSKFIEKYNAQANLKTQYGTYWVILDDSHLIETTKEYSKLYKYSIKDNKLNLTYINDITSMPLVNGKADNDFVQIQNLKSNYFAIHRRPKELYIFRFNGEAETISLAKYINDFDNISINANNIQFTKNGIINIISIAYEKMLYSINIGANTLYNTIGSTVNASHVLDEEIYFDVNGKQIGTMPNNGILNITPGVKDKTIPLGYTSGGTVKGDSNLLSENIVEGKTIFGVTGNATGSQLRLVQRNIEYPQESNIEINVYDSARNKIDLLGNNSYLINTNPVYIQIEQNGYKYNEQEKSITVNSYIDAQIPELTNILTDDYENSNLNLTGTINNQSPSYSSSGTLTFNTIKDYKGLYTNGSSYITYSLNTSISSYDVQFDFYKANTASYSRVCLLQGPNYEIEIKGSSNAVYWGGELSGGWIQNEWNTLKLHKEGNSVQLYINNKLIATKTYSAAITGIRLGRGNDSGNYFIGYYKNVVITDNNKTPEQPIITITPIGDTIDIIPKDIEQQVAIPEGTIQANVSAIDVIQTQYYEECLELSNQILGITNN